MALPSTRLPFSVKCHYNVCCNDMQRNSRCVFAASHKMDPEFVPVTRNATRKPMWASKVVYGPALDRAAVYGKEHRLGSVIQELFTNRGQTRFRPGTLRLRNVMHGEYQPYRFFLLLSGGGSGLETV